jgi:Holliday junction resolvasome RuvABC endonuclease subunit
MTQELSADLVLAIHPFSRGFAFALLEAPLSPIDWGVREVKGPNPERQYLALAQALVEQMQPDVLVLSRLETSVLHRSKRRDRFQRLLANYARGEGVRVVQYARVQVLACFEGVGAVTRYQIAQAIAAQIHAFAHRVPPPRKVWEADDARMFLFDAIALALTHYCTPVASAPDHA